MSDSVLKELVMSILEVLSGNVAEIILYGSVARQTDTPESDVDVAVLLKSNMSAEEEERLSDAIVDLNLKYDRVFSVIDIDYAHFKDWENDLPFYRNVRKEGVQLWKAA